MSTEERLDYPATKHCSTMRVSVRCPIGTPDRRRGADTPRFCVHRPLDPDTRQLCAFWNRVFLGMNTGGSVEGLV